MKAVGTRVIVKRTVPESVSDGGIIIPEQAQSDNMFGAVVSVGEGVEAEVAEGDVVHFGKYAGQEITIAGIDYIAIKDEDILAIL